MILDWMSISIVSALFWSLYSFSNERKSHLLEELRLICESGILFILFLTIQTAFLSKGANLVPVTWRFEAMALGAGVLSFSLSLASRQKTEFAWILFTHTVYLLWIGPSLYWKQEISGSLYLGISLFLSRLLFFSVFERLRFSQNPAILKEPVILLTGAGILVMALWKIQEIILLY